MRKHRQPAPLLMVSAILLASACDGGNGGGTAPPPPPPTLVIEKAAPSGDGQLVIAGQPIASPLRVKVTRGGAVVSGQAVTWSASAGTIAGNGATNSEGVASASWNLGTTPGTQTATAFAGSLAGPSSGFTATAVALPPGSTTVKLFSAGGARFEPAMLVVPAGTTVSFVWQDGFHDLLSSGSPSFVSVVNGSDPPKIYQVTFATSGTYQYYCSVHGTPNSGMRGTVIVQ